MDCGWRFFHFLERPRKRNIRIRPRHGSIPALLTIGGVCGTRCAQTATDPPSADGCDARPVTKGQMGSPLAQSIGAFGDIIVVYRVSGLNIQQNENRLCQTHASTVTAKNRRAVGIGDGPGQPFKIKSKLFQKRAKAHPILRFLGSEIAPGIRWFRNSVQIRACES